MASSTWLLNSFGSFKSGERYSAVVLSFSSAHFLHLLVVFSQPTGVFCEQKGSAYRTTAIHRGSCIYFFSGISASLVVAFAVGCPKVYSTCVRKCLYPWTDVDYVVILRQRSIVDRNTKPFIAVSHVSKISLYLLFASC